MWVGARLCRARLKEQEGERQEFVEETGAERQEGGATAVDTLAHITRLLDQGEMSVVLTVSVDQVRMYCSWVEGLTYQPAILSNYLRIFSQAHHYSLTG